MELFIYFVILTSGMFHCYENPDEPDSLVNLVDIDGDQTEYEKEFSDLEDPNVDMINEVVNEDTMNEIVGSLGMNEERKITTDQEDNGDGGISSDQDDEEREIPSDHDDDDEREFPSDQDDEERGIPSDQYLSDQDDEERGIPTDQDDEERAFHSDQDNKEKRISSDQDEEREFSTGQDDEERKIPSDQYLSDEERGIPTDQDDEEKRISGDQDDEEREFPTDKDDEEREISSDQDDDERGIPSEEERGIQGDIDDDEMGIHSDLEDNIADDNELENNIDSNQDDVDMTDDLREVEENFDEDIADHFISKKEHLPEKYRSGNAVSFHNRLKKKADCPGRMKRMNLNARNAKKFQVMVVPNANRQTANYALDEMAFRNGKKAFVALKKGDKVVIMPRRPAKHVYMRQLCGWTFTVNKVKVKVFGKRQARNFSWSPVANKQSWFNYGCTTNDWTLVKKIELTMQHNGPRFNLKDIFCEICV